MLKKLKITNFYSIGETQELSLDINNKDILDDSACRATEDLNLNLVTTIVGHNSSGKTNILKALTFLVWFVHDSYTATKSSGSLPVEPHKLKKDQPIKLEIEFLNKETLYNYYVELTPNEVIKEFLGEHVEKGFTRIFEYERKGEDWDFKTGANLKINETDKDRFKKRKHVSVFSSLIDTGYLDHISFFKTAHSNVSQFGYHSASIVAKFFGVSETLYKDKELREQILSFVKNIDLGIADFKFNETVLRNRDNPEEEIKKHILECIHGTEKGNFSLELIEESNGTLQGFSILTDIFPVLKTGGIVVLDEIEDSLHPHVLKKVVSLFESRESNPNCAQLIFATHQHLLLKDRTKTQIYLTEKSSETLETEFYRLDDVDGVRNDENYFLKYLAGVYGGVGNIDWL